MSAPQPRPPHPLPYITLDIIAQPAPLDQLAAQHTTPKSIAKMLRREFTFVRDQDLFGEVDYWQAPEEFLARRAGDCEDYALMAQALLLRNGYDAYVFSLFGEGGYAHTVAVFRDAHGKLNVINQGKLRSYRASSFEELAGDLYPAWTFGCIAERDGTRGRMLFQVVNLHPAPGFLPPGAFGSDF